MLAQPLVEPLCLFDPGLGEDDRELVAAVAGCDVGRAQHLAEPVGDAGERDVPDEVTEPVVDLLEVVEVEDDEREAAVVAARAGDLALERLFEVARVVQARPRVEVGEPPRLEVAPRVVERRTGAGGDVLERALASRRGRAGTRRARRR